MQKADRDTAALCVLGLLKTGPRHPYEMHIMIVRTHKTFVSGLPRSIYHAAQRLLAAAHIRVAATTRDGVRPERTVYELTDSGEQRLRNWVLLLLGEPDANSSLFVPALTFAGVLTPGEVAAALRDRRAELARREEAATSVPPELPRILVLEAEYEAARLRAETEWVGRVIDDLDAGVLHWPADLTALADIEALIKED
ncbi:PadR family transcriptional regulator [Dactylosporangium cerinum]|uniref:PadR family transcriptional regulator n=1 Tax=Dactylosporangium cerinum TaxID=1434730 RepID=A0ABV9WHT0_9ACTN